MRRIRRIAPLVLALSGCASAGSPPARILFQTFPYIGFDTPYGLGVANADGSDFVDLTASVVSNHHAARQAAWSPDASEVAFALLRTSPNGSDLAAGEIYVVGADGRGMRRLTLDAGPGNSNEHPAWSPDGRRIAWLKRRRHGSDVRVMSAAGDARRAVTTDGTTGTANTSIGWSPDGRRLGWLKHVGSTDIWDAGGNVWGVSGNVWLAHSDGSGARALTTSSRVVRGPLWQPGGSLLLYAEGARDTALHVVDPSIGPPGVVIRTAGDTSTALEPYGSDPVWSPSGSRIAWGDVRGVGVATPDGHTRRVASTEAFQVAWAPDESKLAFAHEQILPPVAGGECECANVYVVDVNGGRPRNVSGREGMPDLSWWQPLWWPDSTRLTIGGEASIVNVNADGTCRRQFPARLETSRSGPLMWQPGRRALPSYPRCVTSR